MMTTLLALLVTSQAVSATPCERPADCGPAGVCVAGECRVGSARALVQVLSTVAVPQPALRTADPALGQRATQLARRVERALAWTGFYTVLPQPQHPRVPQNEVMSRATRALWRTFGADRVLRLRVEHGPDPGGLAVQADLVETDGGHVLPLSAGVEQLLAGSDRRAVARWINALVGHDTGLPGCVGTRLLASVEVRRGNKEVAVVEVDGSGLTFVTDNGSLNIGPTWGPDGQVGYMSYLRRNTDWVVNGAPFSTRAGLNAAGDWSPDGRLLALTVTEDGNSDLVLLDAVTGEQRARLTDDPGVDTSAVWAPDGVRLAFVSDRTGGPQIWIYDLRTDQATRLTEAGYMSSPAWSPLGDTIVYTQLISGISVLLRHDLDPRRVTRLTAPPMGAETPTISPDGRYVVFVRRVEGEPPGLWRIPMRGGEPQPLAQHAWPLYAPDWQP